MESNDQIQDDKITIDKLFTMGFVIIEQSNRLYKRTKLRKESPDFRHSHFDIEITSLPEENPNCIVVSLFSPETEAHGVPKDLLRKKEWTEEDMKRAAEYRVKINREIRNIAWSMTSIKRLKDLYFGLFNVELIENYSDVSNDLPSNLDEAVKKLLDIITQDEFQVNELEKYKDSELEFTSSIHHFLGRNLRNEWNLWWYENHKSKTWPKEKPKIVEYFNNLKIYHADDMSGIILTTVYRTFFHLPINLDKQIEVYHNHWIKQTGNIDFRR